MFAKFLHFISVSIDFLRLFIMHSEFSKLLSFPENNFIYSILLNLSLGYKLIVVLFCNKAFVI